MNLKNKVKSSEIDSCVQINKKSGSKNLKQHLFVYQTVSVDIAALSGQSTNERENMKQSSDFFLLVVRNVSDPSSSVAQVPL